MPKVLLQQERTEILFLPPNTDVLYFTVLHFIVLHRLRVFYELRARPSTSIKTMTGFMVVGLEPEYLQGVPGRSYYIEHIISESNRMENKGFKRYSNALIMAGLPCVIVCYFMCPLHLKEQ